MGGYAGCGKTYCGKRLSKNINAIYLDKDTLSRPLTELLLNNLEDSEGPDDRHSDSYLKNVRPLEYKILLDTALENTFNTATIVLNAPFITEFKSENFIENLLDDLEDSCEEEVKIIKVWVNCSIDTMKKRIIERDAKRDYWKIKNWDKYSEKIDENVAQFNADYVIDNELDIPIEPQVEQIKEIISEK